LKSGGYGTVVAAVSVIIVHGKAKKEQPFLEVERRERGAAGE
jgi:hypothetical protein